MLKVTVILKGGPHDGEQFEAERGRPYIEVAKIDRPCEPLTDRNCNTPAKAEYIRSLYKLSNRSDLEYDYCEPK